MTLSSTAPRWYLLQCKARQQGRAELHLQNQGFEFFAPVHTVKRLARGRVQTLNEPLFPGYVFVRLDAHSNWRALHATRGVSRLVSFSGSPCPVADMLIAALKQREQVDIQPVALFQPGEKVVITEGCFKYVEAIVKAVTSDERIIVLMNILHSEQALSLMPAQLARAG